MNEKKKHFLQLNYGLKTLVSVLIIEITMSSVGVAVSDTGKLKLCLLKLFIFLFE